MRRLVLLLGTLAATLGVLPTAEAQQRLDVSARPNYGARDVTPGFTPDPMRIEVTSGGNLDVNAMHLGQDCRGFATAAPDFNFTLTRADAFLRVFVDAGSEDTTLIINKPDGSWVCADDTYGRNPGIDLRNAPQGLYNVWVGSYQASTRAHGTLAITELASQQPGAGAATTAHAPAGGPGLDVSGRPNFGTRALAPGFTPDPVSIPVTSGGSLDASTLGLGEGCRGFVTSQPDFNLVMSESSPTLRVYVDRAQRRADTTLIINLPDGRWVCNDDSYGGTNPSIDLPNAGAGTYNVWIGSYQAGVMARAKLNITELANRHP